MENFTPTHYTLECVATGRQFEDEGWMLDDPCCKIPSMIRTRYAVRQIDVRPDSYGFYKFCDWLPVRRMLQGSSAPVTYKSKGLADYLGLKNLYITFNGYYPEIGAKMTTCSFKETEAYSVCARIREGDNRILVVASAGNTARAFAKVCSDNNIPLLLSVPEENISALWFDRPLNPCVKLICPERGGDYFDAIFLGSSGLRRDDVVGSGTGAIAAWEANMRLNEDGRFGNKTMKLVVSQNAPFVPMFDAWRVDSREMLPYEAAKARRDAEIIDAKVLSNRKPPYSLAGGLYDALKATGGDIMVATNAQARKARALFEETEGIDIYSAAGIATASLVKSVADGRIDPEKIVMLNITGGGEHRCQQDKELWYLEPSLVFPLTPDPEEVVAKTEALFD